MFERYLTTTDVNARFPHWDLQQHRKPGRYIPAANGDIALTRLELATDPLQIIEETLLGAVISVRKYKFKLTENIPGHAITGLATNKFKEQGYFIAISTTTPIQDIPKVIYHELLHIRFGIFNNITADTMCAFAPQYNAIENRIHQKEVEMIQSKEWMQTAVLHYTQLANDRNTTSAKIANERSDLKGRLLKCQ